MRGALPILVLLAIVAIVVAWTMFHSDVDELPRTAEPSAPSAAVPHEPAPAERSEVTRPAPAPTPTVAPEPPKVVEPPRADAAPITAELHVRDVTSQQPIAAFRWRFQSGATTTKGDGENGAAALRLPPATSGRLLVEADSFQPWTHDVTTPADAAPPLSLDAFLAPAAAATGITLLVHDTAQRPIKNIRVDAFVVPPENRGDSSWSNGTPLWARRTSAPDGRYVLPELAPGQYGIRVTAVDERGSLLPMLPFLRRFELTGSNGFVEDVPLEPGCVLVLDLVDAAGNPLDPTRVGTTTLQLHLAGGPTVPRRWTVTTGALVATATDVLPGVGQVLLAEAVPAGSYELNIGVAGRPVVQRTLTLRAGDVPVERVVVP